MSVHINLELTDHCNIKCTMCSQSMRDDAHGGPKKFMSWDTWRKALQGLADLDGDGDIDAFVGRDGGADSVWLNDGSGSFTDSGQSLGSGRAFGVALGDFDADGDMDAFVANLNAANTVWTNNGSGVFSDSGQSLGGTGNSNGVALGDVDADGDLDVVVANGGWLGSATGEACFCQA